MLYNQEATRSDFIDIKADPKLIPSQLKHPLKHPKVPSPPCQNAKICSFCYIAHLACRHGLAAAIPSTELDGMDTELQPGCSPPARATLTTAGASQTHGGGGERGIPTLAYRVFCTGTRASASSEPKSSLRGRWEATTIPGEQTGAQRYFQTGAAARSTACSCMVLPAPASHRRAKDEAASGSGAAGPGAAGAVRELGGQRPLQPAARPVPQLASPHGTAPAAPPARAPARLRCPAACPAAALLEAPR
ncbi:uncharacterized protein LOC130610508, partial [Pezoporus wallicus]